jgi:hypothetical protein
MLTEHSTRLACCLGWDVFRIVKVYARLIIALAARHRLPAVYPFRFFITSGGLISYGPDIIDQYRQAAGYIDRIFAVEGS